MKKATKATYIVGIVGAIATIVASIIGLNGGKSIEQKNIQQQVNNILGDNSNVTINDISEIVLDYENLKEENESFKKQNIEYFNNIEMQKEEINELKNQAKEIPIFEFQNLKFFVDGREKNIDAYKSAVTIDGKTYYSKDFITSLLEEDQSISTKDGTLFVGKVISEKTNLFQQWIVDSVVVEQKDNTTDTYGNKYTNAMLLRGDNAYIIYNMDRKYSNLKFDLAVNENSNGYGIIIIKADDNIVYTSQELMITTEPIKNIDIPINNCSLLTIELDGSYDSRCIISEAIAYN